MTWWPFARDKEADVDTQRPESDPEVVRIQRDTKTLRDLRESIAQANALRAPAPVPAGAENGRHHD